MRSANCAASATAFFCATVEGSAATSERIWGRGSMASPRTAVTPCGVTSATGVFAPLMKTEWDSEDWDVKLPRSRKMADGFSLESLCGTLESDTGRRG